MIKAPDFLPLGSIVVLKGNKKKCMVIARAMVVDVDAREKEYYDYGMCMYPEGLLGDALIYTNHDCIDEVVCEGFKDEEDTKILDVLKPEIEKLDVKKAQPKPIKLADADNEGEDW